ncbi:DUF7527 domain-containing protein [Halonotius aquaticus]|uniref:DUF7527 domain-containing protein n=1 Tax=Halonotius aquaticus TaxID=2216978 RepID=UPI000E71ACA8|nr:hypothetical protein [Halonotius aquaticus]
MDSDIVTAVTDWETVPVDAGYAGLHALADAEFSGAVNADDAWGFMLNGRLVGIRDGSLGAFDGAAQTAYEAPTPALPLLYTMQTQDNEKQAEYYTNETAIAEADSTLSGGNFTGYIELSENVLSGDYYIVYYGGRSMSVAFVGNSRRLLTDEEAFDRANDEVGIYDVYAADIDVIDLPERDTPATTTEDEQTDVGATSDGSAPATDTSAPTTDEADADAEPSTSDRRREAIDIPQAGSADDSPASDDTAVDDAGAEPTTAADTSEDGAEPTVAADTDDEETATTEASEPPEGIDPTGATAASDDTHDTDHSSVDGSGSGVDSGTSTEPTSTADTGSTTDARSTADTTTPADTGSAGTTTTDPEPFEEEAAWRNTTTIPSLDPSDDDTADNGSGGRADSARRSGGGGQQTVTRSDDRVSRKQLQQRLQKAEEVMEKAEEKHRQLAAERDDAREELAVAEERIDELEADLAAAKERIEELEAQLEAAESAGGTDAAGGTSTTAPSHTMDTASALAGTNLFVRYDSKGEATLADAHDGEASKEDVAANIRLDTHTTFDTEGLEVDGTPFEAFLAERIEVAFAEWLVTDLLFELRATGGTTALSAVADTIPEIDRVELHGTIELGTDEDDEPIEREFDCVVRDKRGKPLCVANFDSSKEPVGAELIEGLIRDGNALRERNDSFAASFAVTSSYFTEDAYEMADDATGSGLFSRSGGKSFVNISRKQGFHLCLVDRIKGGFELQKPEL